MSNTNNLGLGDSFQIIMTTKIFTAFDAYQTFYFGTKVFNSANGMMMALAVLKF